MEAGDQQPEVLEKASSSTVREGKPASRINPKTDKIICQTRCNPKLNYKLIQNLNGEPGFRKVLLTLGLESLLNLQLTRLQRELCTDLARKIDVGRSLLVVHGQEIPLTYASVTKIMGFPCSGKGLDYNSVISKDEIDAACSRFKLGTSCRISQYTLWDYLQQKHQFDNEFKAKFLLFTIATMVRPTTNVHIHFREFIPLLNGIETLCDFNWAKLLLDGLLDSVHAFQLRSAKSLGGCLLYIQLLYFHCVSPLAWTHFDGCLMASPCLRYWNDESVGAVLRVLRGQGGLQSDKVTVTLLGIPTSDAPDDTSVNPQTLMTEVSMARLKRRLDDTETELDSTFRKVTRVIRLLDRRVKILEACLHGQNVQ